MRKRRDFLKGVASATTAIPFTQGFAAGAVVATGSAHAAAPPTAAPLVGYTCFGQDEAAFVEAMVNIMCPADALTPSGVD